MNLSFSYPSEEYVSELTNQTITTSKKVSYKDISLFEVQKVLHELDKDYEVTLTAKLKPLPEDTEGESDDEHELAEKNPIIPE